MLPFIILSLAEGGDIFALSQVCAIVITLRQGNGEILLQFSCDLR